MQQLAMEGEEEKEGEEEEEKEGERWRMPTEINSHQKRISLSGPVPHSGNRERSGEKEWVQSAERGGGRREEENAGSMVDTASGEVHSTEVLAGC